MDRRFFIMHKITLLLFTVAFCSLPNVNAQESSNQELETRILGLVQPYLDAEIINCAAIGVIDGDMRLTLSAGQFSKEDATKADENTIFEIGSISKVFTGVLLADAIERGVVKADQPAGDLLPDGVSMPVYKTKPERLITLSQLSTHVSGLPRMPSNISLTNHEDPYASYDSKEMFEFLNSHELSRKPGISEEYSNYGVALLGELLSQKQKTDYAKLLETRITKPLGMSDTSILPDADQKKRLAPPNDGSCNPATSWYFGSMAGAGAIRSTVNDMLKFAAASLKSPESDTGKAIELAFTQQRKPKGYGSNPMGFGWMINPSSQTRWHNGQTGGYHSIMYVNREYNRAVVVLSNTATGEVDKLGSEIMALLNGQDVKPREFRKVIQVSEELCERYVGAYKLNEALTIDVAYAEGTKTGLTVQLTGQPAFAVFPESETRWFLKVVEADIEFTVDDDGKCVSLTLHQNGMQQTAKKQ